MKGLMAAELAESSTCAPYAQSSSAFSFGGFLGVYYGQNYVCRNKGFHFFKKQGRALAK